jgi:hypothetical protein
MAYHCPNCEFDALDAVFAMELPANNTDDETTLQTIRCADCGLSGIAVYRENHWGALGDDKWDFRGYVLSEESLLVLLEKIALCPAPDDKHCRCAVHDDLGGKESWISPAQNGLEVKREFAMRRPG